MGVISSRLGNWTGFTVGCTKKGFTSQVIKFRFIFREVFWTGAFKVFLSDFKDFYFSCPYCMLTRLGF